MLGNSFGDLITDQTLTASLLSYLFLMTVSERNALFVMHRNHSSFNPDAFACVDNISEKLDSNKLLSSSDIPD